MDFTPFEFMDATLIILNPCAILKIAINLSGEYSYFAELHLACGHQPIYEIDNGKFYSSYSLDCFGNSFPGFREHPILVEPTALLKKYRRNNLILIRATNGLPIMDKDRFAAILEELGELFVELHTNHLNALWIRLISTATYLSSVFITVKITSKIKKFIKSLQTTAHLKSFGLSQITDRSNVDTANERKLISNFFLQPQFSTLKMPFRGLSTMS